MPLYKKTKTRRREKGPGIGEDGRKNRGGASQKRYSKDVQPGFQTARYDRDDLRWSAKEEMSKGKKNQCIGKGTNCPESLKVYAGCRGGTTSRKEVWGERDCQ